MAWVVVGDTCFLGVGVLMVVWRVFFLEGRGIDESLE